MLTKKSDWLKNYRNTVKRSKTRFKRHKNQLKTRDDTSPQIVKYMYKQFFFFAFTEQHFPTFASQKKCSVFCFFFYILCTWCLCNKVHLHELTRHRCRHKQQRHYIWRMIGMKLVDILYVCTSCTYWIFKYAFSIFMYVRKQYPFHIIISKFYLKTNELIAMKLLSGQSHSGTFLNTLIVPFSLLY